LIKQQKEDDLNQLRQEMLKIGKLKETVQRKLKAIEEQKIEVEHQRETLKGQLQGMERGSRTHLSSFLGNI